MKDVLYLAWRYLTYHRVKSFILVGAIALIVYLPVGLQVLVGESAKQLTARAEATPLLIGEDEPRPGQQRSAHGHALLLPLREVVGETAQLVTDADIACQRGGSLAHAARPRSTSGTPLQPRLARATAVRPSTSRSARCPRSPPRAEGHARGADHGDSGQPWVKRSPF